MGRPLAYEYKGFFFDGKSYPVWTDDTNPKQFYVMPPALEVATDEHGPKVTVSVCESLKTPAIDGLANLVPYISNDLMEALKAEYGNNIAPLPVSTGGQVLIVGPSWTRRGLAVHKPWSVDETSYEGLSPEQIAKLKEIERWYEQDDIQSPLTSVLDKGEGFALEIPKLVGSNIGAEVPIAFVVLGADPVKRLKGLLDAPGGGILNGELLYHYVGTTRPWAIRVKADLARVHQYISENLSVGHFWAKADIYQATERMEAQSIIEITTWDENDNITAKYKPEKIFDTLLNKILDKAFNFYPDIKPEKNQAQESGNRFWWWSGSYQRKSSTVDLKEMINIKITIHGKSEPIPVSSGLFLRVPAYSNCDDRNRLHEMRTDLIRAVNLLPSEDLVRLTQTDFLAPHLSRLTKSAKDELR